MSIIGFNGTEMEVAENNPIVEATENTIKDVVQKPKRVRPSRAKPKVVVEAAAVPRTALVASLREASAAEVVETQSNAAQPLIIQEDPPIVVKKTKPAKPRAPAKSRRTSKAVAAAATVGRSNSDVPLTDAACIELADTTSSSTCPPPNPREKFRKFVAVKAEGSLTDIQIRDIEIGIFNWSLDKADERRIPRNWNNPRFYDLYMSKARSIAANLITDSYVGNDRLTQRIKDDEFIPHDVVTMSADRVCPERWQTVVEAKIRHDEYISTAKPTAMTDQFLCGRCKKRECSFMELQTRSCDEPASIFVCCLSCGHRWRMG
jgi:DNA-directed RNA polymerase subunit M/transcription elongation factor TFIIS